MIARWLKILMVATAGLFFTLVAVGNATDYDSNFQFVKHVLSMDTIFPNSTLKGRAITAVWAHHLAYWVIIVWEFTAAALCWFGAWRLFRHRSDMAVRFNKAKAIAVAGLGAGFLLFTLGFITIGSEWFLMWQSKTWNGQGAAHIFLTFTGIILIYLSMKDDEIDDL